MPFDLIGFSEAAPGANGKIAAGGGDNLYRTSGDDIILKPLDIYLLGVFYAAESTGAEIKIMQPSLNIDYQFRKAQLLADLDPSQGYTHLFGRPVPLIGGEKINVEQVNATDEDAICGLLVGTGKIPMSSLDAVNPTHVIHGYSDTTLTANSWKTCTVTWDQDLPSGKYAVVGMLGIAWITSGIMSCLMRLVIPGNNNWRPGVPVAIAEADHEELQSVTRLPFVDWPLMPEIVIFDDKMPNVECLSPAALTDEDIVLQLVKTG